MKLLKNKKGTIMLYLTFVGIALIIVLLSSVIAPMGAEFSTQMYEAGEEIMTDTLTNTVPNINNAEIRSELNESFSTALDSTQDNIDISTDFFKYGGWIVIIITAFVVFVFARRLVEYGSGGGII